MIITVSIMGTVIVALIQMNLNTWKKLKTEKAENDEVMEEVMKVIIKYFYLTNNIKGLKQAEQKGLNVERLKNKEIEIKVIEK